MTGFLGKTAIALATAFAGLTADAANTPWDAANSQPNSPWGGTGAQSYPVDKGRVSARTIPPPPVNLRAVCKSLESSAQPLTTGRNNEVTRAVAENDKAGCLFRGSNGRLELSKIYDMTNAPEAQKFTTMIDGFKAAESGRDQAREASEQRRQRLNERRARLASPE